MFSPFASSQPSPEYCFAVLNLNLQLLEGRQRILGLVGRADVESTADVFDYLVGQVLQPQLRLVG